MTSVSFAWRDNCDPCVRERIAFCGLECCSATLASLEPSDLEREAGVVPRMHLVRNSAEPVAVFVIFFCGAVSQHRSPLLRRS